MFSIENIYTKASTVVKVKDGDSSTDFVISSVISKRNKEELDDDRQFLLLNDYVKWKGDNFKHELYSRYQKSSEDILDTALHTQIYPLPVYIINPVLDMFDLNDMVKFLKEVKKLPAPSNLADDFDEMIENDGRGTRVQTYIKDDYIQLAALVIIIKAVIGIIGQFAYVRSKDVNTVHKNYILYQFLRQHPLFKSDPAEKLLGLIDKVVNLPTNEKELDSKRTLEKQLPKDEIPTAVLAQVVIEKLPIACIVDDNKDKNIITKVYNYVNNKLKAPGDSTKAIKSKTLLSDSESGSGDSESIIESTRIISNLSTATPLEISWAINTVDKILHQVPKYMLEKIDKNVIKDALVFTKIFTNGNLNKAQVELLAFLFKDVIDPRAIDYVDIESIINLLSVGFAYLWGLDFKRVALILVAQQNPREENTLTINSTVNRTRITKEMKDELEYLFPYKRVINEDTKANLVEEMITMMVNDISEVEWIHTADNKYVLEVLPDRSSDKILPMDLKLQIASLIIQHERMR